MKKQKWFWVIWGIGVAISLGITGFVIWAIVKVLIYFGIV